jgi:hypothetical protein
VKPFFSRYPSCRDYNIDEVFEENYQEAKIYFKELLEYEAELEASKYNIALD